MFYFGIQVQVHNKMQVHGNSWWYMKGDILQPSKETWHCWKKAILMMADVSHHITTRQWQCDSMPSMTMRQYECKLIKIVMQQLMKKMKVLKRYVMLVLCLKWHIRRGNKILWINKIAKISNFCGINFRG